MRPSYYIYDGIAHHFMGNMSVLTQVFIQGAVNGEGLRDIKPPLAVSQSLFPYFIGAVVIFGFVAASVWLYFRRRYQTLEVSVDAAIDVRLPHEVAYEQLQAIAASDLLALGDMETYHTQIAYVLREYISNRYQIPALELTTTGLFDAMLCAKIATPCVERTQQLLANCDVVKFATYQPEISEASARIADAWWIVDETKPSAP